MPMITKKPITKDVNEALNTIIGDHNGMLGLLFHKDGHLEVISTIPASAIALYKDQIAKAFNNFLDTCAAQSGNEKQTNN